MKKSPFRRVMSSLKPYTIWLIISIFMAVIYASLSLYIPVLVGDAIDLIIEKGKVDFNGLSQLFIKIGICLSGASLGQYFMTLVNNRLTYSLTRDLREKTFKKIQKLPLSYLDSHPLGDIVSRMVSDIDTLSDGLLLGFSQVFTGVISILITLIYMFILNWIMALVVIILTPLSLFVAKFISRRINKFFKKQAVIRGEQTSFIEEVISGQKVIRAFNHEKKDQEKFNEISLRLEDASLKANFFSSLVNPCTRFINAIVYAIIAFIGAIIVIRVPSFSVGNMTTFLSYANQYTKPFNDISSVVTELQNALTCANRVYELLDEKIEPVDKEKTIDLQNVEGKVEIKNVYFAYEPNQKLIEDFNLVVKPGQKIAIVGPTGCGKTTLINLLMRFYDVNKGEISIDGISLFDLKRASIRKNYGMVLQDTWLRYGTIRDNITMGNDVSEEELLKAAHMSHVDYFVSRLPQGYDTIIDENGGQLSQGQKQLICIARVMVNIPAMLILDEATSSIDTRTELKIQDAFNQMMKGRTSFIVAHRLSTIKEADIIIVMNDGHIIEQGNHNELLAKKGFYYKLYNSQFEK